MIQRIHHFVISHDSLYNSIKFSQKFPFKQVRRYCRNSYIKNYLGELSTYSNKKPIGQVCIETSSVCNTACSFCPHSTMEREKKVMDDETFERVLDQIKGFGTRNLGMYFFGEPMTDPKLAERIKQLKSGFTSYVQIVSNGLILKENRAKELIESGVDEVLFSLDASTEEEYKKVRKGSFEKVLANIEGLISLKKYMNKRSPKIIVRIMVTKDNRKEVKEFVKTWRDKVDEVQFGRVHDFCQGEDKKVINTPCLFLWTQFIILSNGDVIPCCMDYDGTMVIGNIKKKTLEEIWRGKKLMELRKKHLAGEYPGICANCDMNESLVAKWWNYD